MKILLYIHVGRRQTMEKSLMTKILEANRETKREERFGFICLCLCFECERRGAASQEGERFMRMCG